VPGPETAEPDEYFDAYDRCRRRIALLAGPGTVDPQTAVPACPGWTVRDVVAHLAGLAEDVVAGNTERYAEPDWTAEQVTRRAGPIAGLLADWQGLAPALRRAPLPAAGRGLRSLGRLLFVDTSVHEHDLRGALGQPDPADEAVVLGLHSSVELLGRVLRRPQEAGTVPALRVTAGGESWVLGEAADPVSVDGDAFDLWRGLTGRRSRQQVSELRWSGDATPFLAHWAFAPLQFADSPIAY
jgi:uncharacterized protein (TIGR03083 family)